MGQNFEQNIQNIGVVVKNGNIAEQDVDCIVVPEFNSASSRGGVGYAIEAQGMATGLDAYDEIVKDKALKYGDAVITESGKAGTKLAHVATAGADKENQFMVVQQAVLNALVSADEQGLKHMAIPELGTGIIGSLTQEQAAQAIFNAVHVFSESHPNSSVKNVSLVVYGASTAPAEKVLADKSYLELNHDRSGKKEFNMDEWIVGMKEVLQKKNPQKETTLQNIDVSQSMVEESPAFQEKLAQSPEFSAILKRIKTQMKIALMTDANLNTHQAPDYARKVVEDQGTDYDSVSPLTQRLVSHEFYKRYGKNVIGQENLETLKRLKANHTFVLSIKLDEFVFSEGGHTGFVYSTFLGSGGTIGFVDSLCLGSRPEVGDKMILTHDFMEDPEFGKLEKTNAFIYENGKYTHFYQSYSPLRDDNTVEKVVNVTKSMQQKSKGRAGNDGIEI